MELKNLVRWLMDGTLRAVVGVRENRILLYYLNYSGSNTVALHKLAPEDVRERYELILYRPKEGLGSSSFLQRLHHSVRVRLLLFSSRCVITTHGPFPSLKRDTIAIEAWHGFPLKAMGFMDMDSRVYKSWPRWEKKVDFILSYSTLYSTLVNACVSSRGSQYVITGMPRNDFLFRSKGRELLEAIVGDKLDYRKVVFYLPTFREHTVSSNEVDIEGERLSQNIFRLSDFSWDKLVSFLERNKICLVFKPHPLEAQILKGFSPPPPVLFLTEKMLEDRNIDLYELLNAADVLVTDYSSVYFDYLLLDRPIIFVPTDLALYKQGRGLLLEPYDFWTPGPKVYTYQELEEELLKALEGRDNYKMQREIVRNIVHFYQDGQSSERVWRFILEILGGRGGAKVS